MAKSTGKQAGKKVSKLSQPSKGQSKTPRSPSKGTTKSAPRTGKSSY